MQTGDAIFSLPLIYYRRQVKSFESLALPLLAVVVWCVANASIVADACTIWIDSIPGDVRLSKPNVAAGVDVCDSGWFATFRYGYPRRISEPRNRTEMRKTFFC